MIHALDLRHARHDAGGDDDVRVAGQVGDDDAPVELHIDLQLG